MKTVSINRIYIPYQYWEDWINGMWRKIHNSKENEYLDMAIGFTGNHKIYGDAMRDVIIAWPNAMLHNLTNTSCNRRAFLGHCACCYALDLPEYIVRMAWKRLTETQRALADNEAQKTIDWWIENRMQYEKENKGIYSGMGVQMLLQWDS